MAMSFATLRAAISREPTALGQIRILLDYFRENDLESVMTTVSAVPEADANDSETIWNDAGVLKVSSAP